MRKLKIAMFDTKVYDKESFEEVNKNYNFEIKYFEPKLDEDSAELTKGFEVVCVFVNDIITKKVIKKLYENGVKLLALRCAGYNNLEVEAAVGKIKVVRVPAYSPYSIAEHTIALMLSLNRKIHRAYSRTREANFSINGLMGFDMYGKTAGIIGTGKIAKIVISILKGFGMNIIASDPYPDYEYAEKTGFSYVSLDTIYSESDIISLHCPLTKETEYLINEESISKMKDGVMIINTGRGKLIDTKALIKSLKSKKIGSAGLDVYEEENEYFFEDFSDIIINDDTLARLLTFKNVLVTSHQAFFTKEAVRNIAETTLDNIRQFKNSEKLTNEVTYFCDEKGCIIKA